METISCCSCINAGCFVKLCSDDWIRLIDPKKIQSYYQKGQKIFTEGSPVSGVYFIQKGKAKVFLTGFQNREQIVRFAADGHILGHRGIGNDVYPVSAVAMEESSICFIKNDLLNQLFMRNPRFTIELMMYYSRELRKAESRMKNIAQMNVRGKIAETLLVLYENFGLDEHQELNVPFTREDLASASGSTRQQVVQQLTEFEKDGLIEKNGKKVVLKNLQALREILYKS
ncbi:MAG: Crp/Fnr family transcriptional regulator [Bacteroidia bacterium]